MISAASRTEKPCIVPASTTCTNSFIYYTYITYAFHTRSKRGHIDLQEFQPESGHGGATLTYTITVSTRGRMRRANTQYVRPRCPRTTFQSGSSRRLVAERVPPVGPTAAHVQHRHVPTGSGRLHGECLVDWACPTHPPGEHRHDHHHDERSDTNNNSARLIRPYRLPSRRSASPRALT